MSTLERQKIRFKYLDYRGKVKTRTFEMEVPKFEVIPATTFNNIPVPAIPVESQIIDYLDSIDKKDFMIENEMETIIDYFIPEKKSKVTFQDLLKLYEWTNPQVLVDAVVVYSKMKPKLKGLSAQKQLDLVLETLQIGYKAQTEAYKSISGILKQDIKKNPRYSELKEKYGY